MKFRIPAFITLSAIAACAALPYALGRRGTSGLVAYGDALMVLSLLAFGLAWIGYLRKDGVRIGPRRGTHGAKPAESWHDRIGGLGDIPPSPPPIPDEAGPDTEKYRRLAEAEEKLRGQILRSPMPKKESIRSLVLSGLILFVFALLFQYLLPTLAR